MSHRVAECCCKKDEDQDPCIGGIPGSCCFPDGSCRNVTCAYYCAQQHGVFRPNVQCAGNPCVPPTQKCNCDDETWRKVNLWVSISRIWTHTVIEETDSSTPFDLYYKRRWTQFYVTSYNLTQAQIDAGLLPAIPTDNPTLWPYGTSNRSYGNVDELSLLGVQEFRLDQQCCQTTSQTFTVNGPDNYYYDGQGNSEGPYPTSYSTYEFEPAFYSQAGLCYDCCCLRIPTACAQIGTC